VLPDALGELPGGLPYRLFVPKNYDATRRYPMIVFLHGSGERGTDNQAQINVNGPPRLASDEVQNTNPCFVLAPQCPPGERWQSWESRTPRDKAVRVAAQPSKPMRLLVQLLDELPREFSIDTRRLYLTGLSLGGFGTWELLARRPRMFAAAVPICGRADLTTAPLIKHIPVWAFHGDDDQSVSVEYTRAMVGAMRIFDASIIYTEYPGVGHNSWDRAYVEPNLFAWLFAQRRPQQ
jgi:predicted peptidase